MNVTAIIVTRGDVNDGLWEIVESLPGDWELVIWNNGSGRARRYWAGCVDNPGDCTETYEDLPNLAVYGRYAAIEYASNELIYVQDDDCVVSDPQVIVNEWNATTHFNIRQYPGYPYDHHVVCNMPSEFRHGFYEEHALVGFGAAFHRDAPARAFSTFFKGMGGTFDYRETIEAMRMAEDFGFKGEGDFFRTCDVVFTALTPRVLVDVPKSNLPWAEDDSRMYRQPEHQAQRGKMLELAFRAKDEVDG